MQILRWSFLTYCTTVQSDAHICSIREFLFLTTVTTYRWSPRNKGHFHHLLSDRISDRKTFFFYNIVEKRACIIGWYVITAAHEHPLIRWITDALSTFWDVGVGSFIEGIHRMCSRKPLMVVNSTVSWYVTKNGVKCGRHFTPLGQDRSEKCDCWNVVLVCSTQEDSDAFYDM